MTEGITLQLSQQEARWPTR